MPTKGATEARPATAPASLIAAPDFPIRAPIVCANAHRYYRCEPVVTMRSTPVFMRVLARFSKLRSPCSPRDGVKTGAFHVRLPLAPGRSSTDTHSGAVPFRWTVIKAMIQ